MNNQQSYRQIFKSTSLFGGVQIVQIIISIIRIKAIAFLLGPAGVGINSLLQGGINLVGSLTNMGLSTSAVKDVAKSNEYGDEKEVASTVIVLKRWVWITGVLGFLLMLLAAPWLSVFVFGSHEYTLAFMLVAITLLMGQISAGQSAVLRGLRKLKYIASSSVLGAVIGLVTSLPLYYYFGTSGIVSAMILTSVTGLLISWRFASKIKMSKINVGWRETLLRGSEMIKFGFILSLSGLISNGSTYILQVYISRLDGVEQVGFYNSGFTIINTYVGLVFTAMAADYFPRLTAQVNIQAKLTVEVSRQAEISILILGPLLSFFIVFAPIGVKALYSIDFLPITPMLLWASFGILFKAYSWAVGFIFLAKGASKIYFLNELIANVYMLFFNLIGYYYLGMVGLGLSFVVGYIFYFLQVVSFTKKLYGFAFMPQTNQLFVMQCVFVGSTLITVLIFEGILQYVAGCTIAIICMIYSFQQLQKRLDIISRFKAMKIN